MNTFLDAIGGAGCKASIEVIRSGGKVAIPKKGKRMNIVDIAMVCHETNRAYCEALGDKSQVAWKEAPAWQKDSAVNGVKAHLANLNLTPEQSHDLWLQQKHAEGWKYGPVKDNVTKQHPCCLPYNQLPTDQRAKDYIFTAIVLALKNFL